MVLRKDPRRRPKRNYVAGMGRMVNSDDLVGAAEIAARLGVKRTTVVHDWRRRHPDFPEPIAKLQAAYVWSWPDVESWARHTGRLGR
jgi:predicted DNA-binding transcriptional regulator AlpA